MNDTPLIQQYMHEWETTMRHLISTTIILLFVTFPATAQIKNQPEPLVSAETLALYVPGEFKGVKYRLMKPIDFDPSKTYPLILSLHGGSGRGTQNIKNLLIWNQFLAGEDLRRKHPAFVLAPQSNGFWLDNTSEVKIHDNTSYGVLDEVLEFIDTELSKQYKIDADRVYVLGHSMGGMGTFTAIYQHPDRFAAAIPSAGYFSPWLDAKRIQDVPLWIFHGKPDKVVDYIGSRHVFDRLNKLNANAKFTTLKGVGHGSKNSPAFKYSGDDAEKGYITEYASDRCDKTDHVWDWLFRQKRVDDDNPMGKVYVYKVVDGVNREMEIYFPKGHDASKMTVPGIILFHGGGWGGGSRKAFSYQCNYFASRGMVAATVTYRLRTKADRGAMKDGQSSKRVCIPDVTSAIRWFKQHASELGVDPNRIVAGGGSAGGHISLLGTTNPGLNDPNDLKEVDASVAAYVLFNPALSKSDAQDPDVDFLRHLKADFGPAIVFFGSEDRWLKNGWTPAAGKMKSLGITSVDLRIAEGETHAFFNKQPWKDITLIAADQFLNKLGYLQGKPTLSMPNSGETLAKRR